MPRLIRVHRTEFTPWAGQHVLGSFPGQLAEGIKRKYRSVVAAHEAFRVRLRAKKKKRKIREMTLDLEKLNKGYRDEDGGRRQHQGGLGGMPCRCVSRVLF
jgi:hypothetical protein